MSIVLTFHFPVRFFFEEVPEVDGSCFVSSDPAIEILQEVNVGLEILANRCCRNRFFILKVVKMVPEFD